MKFDKGLEEAKAKTFFTQMVNAIAYCHCRHVVHRDLKPENMVICSESESVKLTDFGFSNIFQDGKTLQTSCGSLVSEQLKFVGSGEFRNVLELSKSKC